MKQNIFDQPSFFAAYMDFRKSDAGFNAALEEPAMIKLLPDVRGKRVLDIGCGTGRLCRFAAAHGASRVLGIDPSERMLARARSESIEFEGCVEYRRAFVEEFVTSDGSFDLIVSSLALHYVNRVEAVFRKIPCWLSHGGVFVFSIEHPIFSAGPREWLIVSGQQKVWPVVNYALEGPRIVHWLGHDVLKCHRTLSSILSGVLNSQLAVLEVVEPCCDTATVALRADAMAENHRPAFLVVKCAGSDGRA